MGKPVEKKGSRVLKRSVKKVVKKVGKKVAKKAAKPLPKGARPVQGGAKTGAGHLALPGVQRSQIPARLRDRQVQQQEQGQHPSVGGGRCLTDWAAWIKSSRDVSLVRNLHLQ